MLEDGESVPVTLYPGPDNPIVSKAITFIRQIADPASERIGYNMVKEVLIKRAS